MKIAVLGDLKGTYQETITDHFQGKKHSIEQDYIEVNTLEELQQYINNKNCSIYNYNGNLCLYHE